MFALHFTLYNRLQTDMKWFLLENWDLLCTVFWGREKVERIEKYDSAEKRDWKKEERIGKLLFQWKNARIWIGKTIKINQQNTDLPECSQTKIRFF